MKYVGVSKLRLMAGRSKRCVICRRVLVRPRDANHLCAEHALEEVTVEPGDDDVLIASRSEGCSPTAAPRPRHASIPSARPWSPPTPTIKAPPKEMTPGVERSMPACITTSICPSAATARIVM